MKRLYIDFEFCFGCHACEVACKQENNLPPGPKWISVKTVGPYFVEGKLRMDFIPMTCKHCVKAPCIEACPSEAITQREDGVVLMVADNCIGCLACIEVCPFGALQFNEERGIAEKCHLCHHRIEQGQDPACVQACQAQAIHYTEISDINTATRRGKARSFINPI